jgi:hypothetical protein
MSGAKYPWRSTLHEPLVQLLAREEDSLLRDEALRDLSLIYQTGLAEV